MKIPGWLNRTNIYHFGLALMLVSLPTSKFLMSIAQFILIFNWLLDREVIGKFRRFFSNKAALIIASVFFIHVIGLLWTSDFAYASKDLRIKLPLLALPVIISTSPRINRRTFYHLVTLFIAANVFGSLVSIVKLVTSDVIEIRNISVFISHIRFALNLSFAVFAGMFLFFRNDYAPGHLRWLFLVVSLWLFVFLVLMESITGLGVVLITSMILLLLFIFHIRQLYLKLASLLVMIAIPVSVFFLLQSIYHQVVPKEPFFHENLDKFTSRGNPYFHDSTLIGIENGHWVGQYLEMDELKAAWNERSNFNFDSLDQRVNPLRFTLIRYLTSRGLRKDADGVAALSNDNVKAVERGIASVDQLKETSFKNRLKIVIWEIEIYRHSGNLKDNSVTQRLEFWRAGTKIIGENFFFGVGTGDIDRAFKEMYPKMKSQLPPEQWWRTHNQYLTVFATLGLLGLLLFFFALIYPGIRLKMFGDYFYFVFFCIASLSMITGDTLDTQAGVTFWAFFTTWFLLGRQESDKVFA